MYDTYLKYVYETKIKTSIKKYLLLSKLCFADLLIACAETFDDNHLAFINDFNNDFDYK